MFKGQLIIGDCRKGVFQGGRFEEAYGQPQSLVHRTHGHVLLVDP